MNSSRKCIALMQMCRTYASKTAVQEVPSSKFNKLKEVQKKYQCDDGVPSYLKGGFKDKVLYQTTLVLMAVGLALSGQTLFKLALK